MEWSNRAVRQLLRKLHNPGAVHDDALGQALQSTTGSATVRDAVLTVTHRALDEYPSIYAEIVKRVDVEGESPDAVAEDLHVSRRSFFRYRAAAISAVAATIDAVARSATRPNRDDVAALSSYATGRYFWRLRTRASLETALQHFSHALERDPSFARAHDGIADVALLQGEYLIHDPRESFARAHAAVERALAIDPALAEGHTTCADLSFFDAKDAPRAKASLELALSIDPTYTTARQFAAWFALFEGRPEVALDHVRAALRHDQGSIELHWTLGVASYHAGLPDTGLAILENLVEVAPDFDVARYELVRILCSAGRYERAREHVTRLLLEEPRLSYAAADAHVAAALGDGEAARAYARSHERPCRSHYLAAVVRAGTGDVTGACEHLRAAIAANEPWTVMARTDGFFEDVRKERRFASLLDQFNQSLHAKRPRRSAAALYAS